MLGWDLAVYREEDVSGKHYMEYAQEKELLYIPPTSISEIFLDEPIRKVAIETVNPSGYPYIFRLRAGDFPHDELKVPKLDIPDDEIIIVRMWDQS